MRGAQALVARVVLVVLVGWGLLSSRGARACGAGTVTVLAGKASADAQRIFFSAHADRTDVITEVSVASSGSDYGVLLPVPAEPILDPRPVSANELDALDQVTAPRIFVRSADEGGGGCGCPLATGTSKGGAGATDSVDASVSHPVNIGPVTAVVLSGTTADAVNAWLTESGFVIPAGQQSLVDAYSGPGRFFIALRRNDTAAPLPISSVGVHFTLPGAQRTLPLRFARLNAEDAGVGFTVFVAAPEVVAPAPPFAALTLKDLDAGKLKMFAYGAALAQAVETRGGHAFVVEGAYSTASLLGRIGPDIESLFEPGSQLTRLSTMVPVSALTDDVSFDQTLVGDVPAIRYVMREPAPARPRGTALGAAAAALALAAFRSRRRA